MDDSYQNWEGLTTSMDRINTAPSSTTRGDFAMLGPEARWTRRLLLRSIHWSRGKRDLFFSPKSASQIMYANEVALDIGYMPRIGHPILEQLGWILSKSNNLRQLTINVAPSPRFWSAFGTFGDKAAFQEDLFGPLLKSLPFRCDVVWYTNDRVSAEDNVHRKI